MTCRGRCWRRSAPATSRSSNWPRSARACIEQLAENAPRPVDLRSFTTDLPGKAQHAAADYVGKVTETATGYAGKVQQTAADYVGKVTGTLTDYVGKAQQTATDYIGKASGNATTYAGKAQQIATGLPAKAQQAAAELPGKAQQAVGELPDKAQKLVSDLGQVAGIGRGTRRARPADRRRCLRVDPVLRVADAGQDAGTRCRVAGEDRRIHRGPLGRDGAGHPGGLHPAGRARSTAAWPIAVTEPGPGYGPRRSSPALSSMRRSTCPAPPRRRQSRQRARRPPTPQPRARRVRRPRSPQQAPRRPGRPSPPLRRHLPPRRRSATPLLRTLLLRKRLLRRSLFRKPLRPRPTKSLPRKLLPRRQHGEAGCHEGRKGGCGAGNGPSSTSRAHREACRVRSKAGSAALACGQLGLTPTFGKTPTERGICLGVLDPARLARTLTEWD